jgi:2-dehydropantoate 2-reductase
VSEAQKNAMTRFCSLLEAGKTPFTICDDIQTQRWKKVVWNIAWNSLTTLTGSDTEAWLKSSDMAVPLTRRLMGEAIDVAIACGVPDIDHGLIDEHLEKVNKLGKIYASMYHDSVHGRAMEVEVILGTPVRKGKELGIPMPTLDILYALLKSMDVRLAREREVKVKK